uniref:ADP-ribosylation factor-like protein n=1 Tax=Neobodo designis TaxID=312471 RepID=A0A7S1PYV6_NEODS|mmetsp:Transcript_25910/g.80034  ORF Transcript_25910/g.80034 Transcript_25910/m.80034 type:complete len:309 (+) Transcript_25910:45-971(+)|eukprot:CAMPEP_0174830616 /NCGR_PEP_ID=MMETSP1114-20130205/2619_1 /TAXON_ID=312471 /ORGANISM="Neobodo designis, Strain CCAP 1951/1" /LENGTH=308 /DNA_ID=CAMNT_0016064417 /DNA_START=44 /DNA_END=970 /DNA_ORIENTATION=+
MSAADQEAKVAYAKKHNIHHLFELLAHRVLDRRPDDVYAFLREQITDIEGVEKRKGTYDPTAAHHEAPHGSSSNNENKPGPSGAPAPAPPSGPKKITIGVFGLDNAGKTSLISCIGGEATKDTTPTVGFTPTNLETPDHHVCIYDLGGGATFRGIWPHYFHDCHGIMFVVDASDKARLAEAAESFQKLVQHEYIRGKPIVVYCNKRDLVSGSAVAEVMGDGGLDVANLVGRDTPTKIAACCAVKDRDEGVDEGADWIITTISARYADLSATVKQQCDAVKQAKKERLEAQRRRVAEAKAAEEAAAASS